MAGSRALQKAARSVPDHTQQQGRSCQSNNDFGVVCVSAVMHVVYPSRLLSRADATWRSPSFSACTETKRLMGPFLPLGATSICVTQPGRTKLNSLLNSSPISNCLGSFGGKKMFQGSCTVFATVQRHYTSCPKKFSHCSCSEIGHHCVLR